MKSADAMGSIGFGLERIGLLAAARPVLALALAGVITALAAVGLAGFRTEDGLGALFRSDTEEYRAFQRLEQRFPASEHDLLLAVSGPRLITPEALERVRLAHLDLQFVEGVAGATSMFSLRRPATGDRPGEPLFPADLPTGSAFDELIADVLANPLIAGRLLTVPGPGDEFALIIAALDPAIVDRDGPGSVIRAVRAAGEESLAGSGLSLRLTGPAAMQEEIRAASARDRILFNSVGFTVGLAICAAFLRRARLVVLAAVPPALAAVWSFGLLSLGGLAFSPLMNTIAPLILVIAFANSVHLVLAVRRELGNGDAAAAAARKAVARVGPACVLTALTTALAVASLALTDSEQIRTFAAAASAATLISMGAVLLVIPAAARLLFSARPALPAAYRSGGVEALAAGCAVMTRSIAAAPRAIVAAGGVLLVLFAAAYFSLEPRYRLSDAVPDGGETRTALSALDEKLGGVIPIQVMVEWPGKEAGSGGAANRAIAEVHRVLEDHPDIANVISLATLGSGATIEEATERLTPGLAARLVDPAGGAALVTGHVRDLDAREIGTIVAEIDRSLDRVRETETDVSVTLSGLPVVSAGLAVKIMSELKLGLLIATLMVIGLIGLAFRSFAMMVLAVLPNLIAIMATGALMFVLGHGLNYPGLVAMTVAFGLAADDTIHFLNSWRGETAGRCASGVEQTMVRVGPALILTSLVLVLGLAVTVFSDLPPNRIFGGLCIATLGAALLGDLILLPASIIAFGRRLSGTNP